MIAITPVLGIDRNLEIYGELIIDTSGDLYLFALDAWTGKSEWDHRILDPKVNLAEHSSGPIIADGKIVSGRSCNCEGGPEACVIGHMMREPVKRCAVHERVPLPRKLETKHGVKFHAKDVGMSATGCCRAMTRNWV